MKPPTVLSDIYLLGDSVIITPLIVATTLKKEGDTSIEDTNL